MRFKTGAVLLLLIAMPLEARCQEGPPPPPSPPRLDGRPTEASPRPTMILATTDGASIFVLNTTPTARPPRMVLLSEGDTLRYKLPDRTWLVLTTQSPPGRYSTRGGDTLILREEVRSPRVLEVYPEYRPTYHFVVHSRRGVALIVKPLLEGVSDARFQAEEPVSLPSVRRTIDLLRLDPSVRSQLVILPESWYANAMIQVPRGWAGMTVQF